MADAQLQKSQKNGKSNSSKIHLSGVDAKINVAGDKIQDMLL
jgi:hypothetical protein